MGKMDTPYGRPPRHRTFGLLRSGSNCGNSFRRLGEQARDDSPTLLLKLIAPNQWD